VGSKVETPGGDDVFALKPHNSLTVRKNGRSCVATFDFERRRKGARATLGPIPCRPSPSGQT
jgi:hypothetical protein